MIVKGKLYALVVDKGSFANCTLCDLNDEENTACIGDNAHNMLCSVSLPCCAVSYTRGVKATCVTYKLMADLTSLEDSNKEGEVS